MIKTYIEDKAAARVAISKVLPVVDGKTGVILELTKYDVKTGDPHQETAHYFIEDLQKRKDELRAQIDEINALISDAGLFKAAPTTGK